MQTSSSPRWIPLIAGTALVLAVGAGLYIYMHRSKENPQPLPLQGDPSYEAYVSAFQLGTAQVDSGLTKDGEDNLTKAIELVPGEPAAWANRAIVRMREGNRYKEAAADLAKARELAPDNPELEEIAGFLAELQNNFTEAKEHFRKASEANPNDLRRLYKISQMIASEANPDADKERLQILERILELQPDNLPVLSEHLRLAARVHDRAAVRKTLDKMNELSKSWHDSTREQLAIVNKEVESGTFQEKLQGLSNLILQEAGYASSAEELSPVGAQIATTLQTFIKLAPVRSTPDEPDRNLRFQEAKSRVAADLTAGPWTGVLPLWLDGDKPPVIFVCDSRQVRRADGKGPVFEFPGGKDAVPPSIEGVLGIDWDSDQKTDIVLAGAGGLRFHHQKADGSFEDVTARTKLPAAVLADDYFGAWAVDIDFDGDLDILVARRKGPPLFLRNNFDGTFTAQPVFQGVEDVRVFAWLDLDHDGAPDAALLDASGRLHVFMNQRKGVFSRRTVPDVQQKYAALTVADVNDDGVLDLIALTQEGSLVRISDRHKGKEWEVAELAKVPQVKPSTPGTVRLIAIDLDNNGAIDIVLRRPTRGVAWLSDGKGDLQNLGLDVPPGVADVVDLDENGTLDFLGLSVQGQVEHSQVVRTKGYQWFDPRPRSISVLGDNRVNSFGLGGEMEIRAGVLVVKQPIIRPVVHFGLGTHENINVLKVNWPNGTSQNEFGRVSGATVLVVQRLKGSCPFLYTWDGERMVFVTDFCWSTPLGMYINAQDQGGFLQTTDWVKIRGDQLVPRDGIYDVRVNANLWETHFLDKLALVVVDHPPGTEVHLDERFFLEPTKPQIYLTGPSKPVARAWDHNGQDVTDIVRTVDGNYLDRAGRGHYQGVTNDHWVEVDLGDEAPTTGPVYLLAHGWIHPTDSSINCALEQNKSVKIMPLTLEIPDGKDGWKVGRPALGFPAGKNKTCVIRLDGIEGEKVTRRFRLRTNLEIYWDALHYAAELDAGLCKQQRLSIRTAELSYRGIVRMSQASASAPELPHYDDVVQRGQLWRDLIGFHTRFGDIRELIEEVDDRFVIMNAGDEIRLTYAAPAAPAAGWKRDFVWISDGWVKDGDLNTRWGKTVLPLPYHGMKSYDSPPGRLEDDPVYRRFPQDWEKYHTRFVTPAQFERGLRNFRQPKSLVADTPGMQDTK